MDGNFTVSVWTWLIKIISVYALEFSVRNIVSSKSFFSYGALMHTSRKRLPREIVQ